MEELQKWQEESQDSFSRKFQFTLDMGIEECTEIYQHGILDAFEAIRQAFADRPLFVMMERKLECDPQTDHLLPKNVYPLYDERISEIRTGLLSGAAEQLARTRE